MKLILSAGQGARNKTHNKKEPENRVARPVPSEPEITRQKSHANRLDSAKDNIQIKESHSTHIVEHQSEMTECMKEDDMRIRNYFRN